MKALTIWQPWASLLACGGKRFETRSWGTSYRGPIAIHAAQKNALDVLTQISMPVALEMEKLIGDHWESLPTGAVIATAELVNVWHIVQNSGRNVGEAQYILVGAERTAFVPSEMELLFGDWTPGRYAWEIAHVKKIPPVPIRGRQRLWNWKEVKAL